MQVRYVVVSAILLRFWSISGGCLRVDGRWIFLRWIDQGSPKDGIQDPSAQIEWSETEWAFSEPDLIVPIPPQEIPATAVLDQLRALIGAGRCCQQPGLCLEHKKRATLRSPFFMPVQPCVVTDERSA